MTRSAQSGTARGRDTNLMGGLRVAAAQTPPGKPTVQNLFAVANGGGERAPERARGHAGPGGRADANMNIDSLEQLLWQHLGRPSAATTKVSSPSKHPAHPAVVPIDMHPWSGHQAGNPSQPRAQPRPPTRHITKAAHGESHRRPITAPHYTLHKGAGARAAAAVPIVYASLPTGNVAFAQKGRAHVPSKAALTSRINQNKVRREHVNALTSHVRREQVHVVSSQVRHERQVVRGGKVLSEQVRDMPRGLAVAGVNPNRPAAKATPRTAAARQPHFSRRHNYPAHGGSKGRGKGGGGKGGGGGSGGGSYRAGDGGRVAAGFAVRQAQTQAAVNITVGQGQGPPPAADVPLQQSQSLRENRLGYRGHVEGRVHRPVTSHAARPTTAVATIMSAASNATPARRAAKGAKGSKGRNTTSASARATIWNDEAAFQKHIEGVSIQSPSARLGVPHSHRPLTRAKLEGAFQAGIARRKLNFDDFGMRH